VDPTWPSGSQSTTPPWTTTDAYGEWQADLHSLEPSARPTTACTSRSTTRGRQRHGHPVREGGRRGRAAPSTAYPGGARSSTSATPRRLPCSSRGRVRVPRREPVPGAQQPRRRLDGHLLDDTDEDYLSPARSRTRCTASSHARPPGRRAPHVRVPDGLHRVRLRGPRPRVVHGGLRDLLVGLRDARRPVPHRHYPFDAIWGPVREDPRSRPWTSRATSSTSSSSTGRGTRPT